MFWKRRNSSSGVSVSGTHQQIPRWMENSCRIYSICAQKSNRVHSSPVLHAKEWCTWPSREATARGARCRATHGWEWKKAEIFRAHYLERYTGEANTELQPTIAGMMQNYNKKFSKMRISNVCKLAGVEIYWLPSVKGFDCENGQLCTCNMSTLEQCSNKLYKMEQLLPTEMEKSYPEQLEKILSTGVAAAVTKLNGRKGGWLSQTTQSAFPGLWGVNLGILQK